MAGSKAALKAAKTALDAQNYAEAETQAQKVLEQDPKNYFANLFLGRAYEKQANVQKAIDAYNAAAKLKPEDELAWKGLSNLYESQGSKGVENFTFSSLELAKVYAEKDDKYQCQTVIDKIVSFAKENGNQRQYKQALEVILPDSPIYDFLEGRLQHPALTFAKIADITEEEEKELINKEIGERRTRLGANLSQVTSDVTREIYSKSNLERLYLEVINWTTDDEVRRRYEEKLFKRSYTHLVVSATEDKAEKRQQVLKMASDIVIIKHPYQLAWEVNIEWRDVDTIAELDASMLHEFIEFFPETGLSKILQAHFGESKTVGIETTPNGDHNDENSNDDHVLVPLNAEERLILLVEGLEDSKDSAFAQRVASDHYLQIKEYESCVETSRLALKLLASQRRKVGLRFERTQDAINLCLATSLIYYQSPKNHPEAKSLFYDILDRKPNLTSALLGIGLVLEEQEEYDNASAFLDRALQEDPENVIIGTEAAWCKVLNGDTSGGLEALESYVPMIESMKSRDLKATTLYRIGKCIWNLRPDKASRKDRHGAYARFISALKADPGFAPAYTSLGVFYEDYSKDKKRARQCFQKAFELSSSEVTAAERLARAFADEGDWDIVEIISQRVIDSGVVRPSPGSKKKGVSWPFAALGVVQMNKQEFPKSIASFQSAIRISPNDYHSWVGLGESYHSSGRYIAAKRTLEYAKTLLEQESSTKLDNAWFSEYILSNVLRELGEYDGALSGYRNVLEENPNEFGVSIALLQALIEQAWHCVEAGYFGLAADSAQDAVKRALEMHQAQRHAFNYWKAVGDACALFSWIPGLAKKFPDDEVREIFRASEPLDGEMIEIDQVPQNSIIETPQEAPPPLVSFVHILLFAILAYKQAVQVSTHDVHAQAIAWYNLGWAEYRASHFLQQNEEVKSPLRRTRCSKAAVRCFKRAIELEAGNSDFWNALGVSTTALNPKVAQHSFVRSLHLNERSARAWSNLGTLYLLQGDHELAHAAFARAQSTDPDYAQAWVGEGLIALSVNDTREALSHFTHAFEIADSSSKPSKSNYVVSFFDQIIASDSAGGLDSLLQPIFALRQLLAQVVNPSGFRHLIALLQERAGDQTAASDSLEKACAEAEAAYESFEEPVYLGQFAKAKSDLSRSYYAQKDYTAAVENAETALNLTTEGESTGLTVSERSRIQLSAHITAGLAHNKLEDIDQAIDQFRAALEESNAAPEIVCLLAQVLWAKGGEEEVNVAKDQLFDCMEKEPGNPRVMALIAAISTLEEDENTLEAVLTDLQSARANNMVNPEEKQKIEHLIVTIAAIRSHLDPSNASASDEVDRSIMLSPSWPYGWSKKAEIDDNAYAADMAARTAMLNTPPYGQLSAEELSRALAGSSTIESAQRAVAVCPWLQDGWESLKHSSE